MKRIIKIFVLALLGVGLLLPCVSNASNIEGLGEITGGQNIIEGGSESIGQTIDTVGKRFLSTAKNIFSGVMLIIMVYAGAQMIVSQGDDEEMLSKSKRMLWYSMIGLFFINMPGTIYEAVRGNRTNVGGGIGSTWSNDISSGITNLFINTSVFSATLNNSIIRFVKVVLVGLSVMIIMISGINIMTARGREEQVNEGKDKIMWALVALMFVGFIEAWQRFAYTGIISDGRDIFKTLANLALFLAVPTTVFFLALAGYYYITAAGDEERSKKGKSIVINTLIGTALLLVSYVFLYDLIQV